MSKPEPSPAATSDVPDKWEPAAPPEGLDRLRGQLVPFKVVFFEEVGSTNDAAALLLACGALLPPAVVTGARQTAGRGTRGRGWFSGSASLAASFVIPERPERPAHHLPLAAGLATRAAVAEMSGEETLSVKWPNDVLLAGRKLAGVLCERRHGAAIVGVGVNLSLERDAVPPELADRVASLAVPDDTARWELLALLAGELSSRLLGDPAGDLAAEWRRHDALLGRRVAIDTASGPVAGVADGIDPAGGLRVIGDDGAPRSVVSGSLRSISD